MNEEIEIPGSAHIPLDVVRVLIEKSVHRATINGCVCRVAFDCQSYPHDLGCLFLGRAFKDSYKTGLESLSVEEALEQAQHAVGLGLVPTIIWEREN